jgi:hypothetical protein
MFVSTVLSKMQFNSIFSNIESGRKLVKLVKFFNPYDDDSLSHYDYKAIFRKRLVIAILSSVTSSLKDMKKNERNVIISAHILIAESLAETYIL